VAYFKPKPAAGGGEGLYAVTVDPAGPSWGTPVLWSRPNTAVWKPTWSTDGLWIAFPENVGVPHGQYQTNYDICRCLAGGASKTDMTNDTKANESAPDWNPAWDPSKP
jgi:Tol biopolymer transport system component